MCRNLRNVSQCGGNFEIKTKTASIMLSMIAAILALVTFTSAPSDPFATEESKPSCREIERNDELYFDAGKGKVDSRVSY